MELDGALRAGKVSTRVVTGIIWIMKRREDPSFTLAQARAIKFAELEVEVPKAPAADGAAASAFRRMMNNPSTKPPKGTTR
jgi:hypothetical protein